MQHVSVKQYLTAMFSNKSFKHGRVQAESAHPVVQMPELPSSSASCSVVLRLLPQLQPAELTDLTGGLAFSLLLLSVLH